jgi:hypothetical protein
MTNNDLSPSLNAGLKLALSSCPGAEHILVSNLYGLPILRVSSDKPASLEPDPIESIFATLFAMTAEQLEKLYFGRAQTVVASYGDLVLVQAALHPLVLAIVARKVNEEDADIDNMLSLVQPLINMLEPVRQKAESLLR